MLLGCTMSGSHGSIRTRPDSISALMSRSESSTASGYPRGPSRWGRWLPEGGLRLG